LDSLPRNYPDWLPYALLTATVIILYWPCTGFDFVEFDDYDYVKANPHVSTGLSLTNIGWAFSSSHAANWHPVTWISHMLDVQLFGPGAFGPHLVNILLHAANTLLLYWLLRRGTGSTSKSLFVALLFGLHPMHVESVAWVSERKDVLSTFFGLLSLAFYGAFAQGIARHRNYLLALVTFALGLMSKPMLVSWPIILLLLDYWPLKRLDFQPGKNFGPEAMPLLREKLPLFFLAALSCFITIAAQHQGGAIGSFEYFPLVTRLENSAVSYVRYLGKLLWPTDLSFLYPFPASWPRLWIFVSTLLLIGLSAAAIAYGRRYRFFLVGWCWFLVTLLPVIGLVQVGGQSMADRYSYIPSVGLFIAIIWTAGELAAPRPMFSRFACILAIIAVVGCAGRARSQLYCWRDTESLYQKSLAVTHFNPLVLRFLSFHYYNLGNEFRLAGNLEDAITRYRRSLELRSDFAMAHNNLGIALQASGKLDEATAEYALAVRFGPTNVNSHVNYGVALTMRGQLKDATDQFIEAVRLAPSSIEAQNDLGAVLYRQGRFGDASIHYAEAARLAETNAGIFVNLGDALARDNRQPEAIKSYQRALQIEPNNQSALKRLQSLGQH